MYRTRLLPVLTLSAGLAMPALTVRADAVISGTPPTLTSQPSRPDQDGIVRGQAALRMKHFDQAERAFGEAYELNPRSVEAMLGLAAATQAQGKTRLARDWMSSAVAIAPGQANVLQAQARLLTEQGLLPDAERSYHAAIASHPGMVQLKLDLAALYLDKLGKPGQAVDLLREVVRQHPEMAAAQLGLGMALSADGKFEEASRSLEDAVRRDPGNAVAHHALGVVSLRQGRPSGPWCPSTRPSPCARISPIRCSPGVTPCRCSAATSRPSKPISAPPGCCPRASCPTCSGPGRWSAWKSSPRPRRPTGKA
jgi:Tfp pilus assembly protein PilF